MAEPTRAVGVDQLKPPPPIPHYFAVGIPQGHLVDVGSGETANGVRRGGEIVFISKEEYAVWLLLLSPKSKEEFRQSSQHYEVTTAPEALARLFAAKLVFTITPGGALDDSAGSLRPLPLGTGLGNGGDDPGRFLIGDYAFSPVVFIDAAGYAVWCEFDGSQSLGRVSNVVAALLSTSSENSDALVTRTTYGLMRSRLAYLDVEGG